MAEKHHSGMQPASRGIPSKEALWLSDIRKLRDQWKYGQNVQLEMEQILQIVFPDQYQAKYYEVSKAFMALLLEELELEGEQVGAFLRDNNFSKATFYNVILPRLRRVGMVKTERRRFHHSKSTQKHYQNIIRPSTQFSKFFGHLAREYESIVETAKARASAIVEEGKRER